MIEYFMFAVLGLLAVVDIIWKKFPAGFLTGLIFLTVIVSYLMGNENVLILTVLSYIIGIMLLEFGVPIRGNADLKVIVMIGSMIINLKFFLIFVVLIMLYGLVYNMYLTMFYGKEIVEREDFAFIPILFFVYLTMYLLGGVIV